MNYLKKQIDKAVELFKTDSLFRNAAFLMASTAIMSGLGFGFWFFVAHLYSPSQIGIASALISITLLISNLSFFGLNAGLLRFLPTSKTRSRDINAALITVGVATMIAASAYLLWVEDDLSRGMSIFGSLFGRGLFILMMVVVSLNTFTDSVFIASRRAHLHTIVYAAFGIVKLVLPIFLVALGSLGIFEAYIAAAAVSLALSFYFMWKSCGYEPLAKPNWKFITQSRKYATNNYVMVLLAGLPSQLMPSLIVARLGSAEAAFFSMAWTMANLLYVIPSAITNSLMAESSHDIKNQARNVRHASRILATVLIPAVILAILIAPYLLRLFGPQYAAGGTVIFQLLAIATFFLAINAVANTVMNLEHRTGSLVIVQAVTTASTLGLALTLMRFGLSGVGLAMVGGTVAGNIVQLTILSRRKPGKKLQNQAAPEISVPRETIESMIREYSIGITAQTLGVNGSAASVILVTSKDRKYVLKMYADGNKTQQNLLDEIEFTRYLGDNRIPVPHVTPTTRGDLVSSVTIDGKVWLGVLMDFEAGQHPEEYNSALIGNMARMQGRIHLMGIAYAALYLDQGKRPKSVSMRSELLRYLPKGFSHFDYDGSNLLTHGNKLSCVLDFEGMRYDPIVGCLYYTLTRLYAEAPDMAKLELYIKDYQTVRRLSFSEKVILRVALAFKYGRSPRMLGIKI